MITLLFQALDYVLSIYTWIIIADVIFSLLLRSNLQIVRDRNLASMLWNISNVLQRIVEPALHPIRRRMPNTGGIDFSPVVLLLAIWIARGLLARIYLAIVTGSLHALLF